jgi:murein hydrolase activator
MQRTRQHLFCAAWLTVALLCAALPASAQESTRDDLKRTKKEATTAQANADKLAAKVKILQAELKVLQEEMVSLSRSIQQNESELSAIEEQLALLEAQITAKGEALAKRKREFAAMIQAAIKLSQTPQEAVILMPGDMRTNMKAGRALKMASDSIKNEAVAIEQQRAELAELKDSALASKQVADERRKQLQSQRADLKGKIDERNKIQRELHKEFAEATAKARSLAKKAEDLQSLVAALDAERREREAEEALARKKAAAAAQDGADGDEGPEVETSTAAPSGERGKLRALESGKSSLRAPASGKLVQKYGAKSRNETSKGITIRTRVGAQVVAPYDAEVVFTGPFLAYGRMIILRHRGGYHTLLAGLSKIDASVGQFLLEGEPIGAMGGKDDDGDTAGTAKDTGSRLYVELRKNNQPIDPTPWIRGLR